MDPIYLDNNATAPLRPEARVAMAPWLGERFGNPSSIHRRGQEARAALDRARETLAGVLHCRADEVYFTSGGTESCNMAVIGGVRGRREAGSHAVVSAIEHQAVLNAARALKDFGCDGWACRPEPDGTVRPQALEEALRPTVVLAGVMHANNETGVLNDIEALGRLCRARGVLFFTDAVQSFGKRPIDLSRLPVDLLAASSHKFGGPQGVGLLFVRRGVNVRPLLHGGEQEKGLRPGTENVAGIVGMAAAALAAATQMDAEVRHLCQMRDRLQVELVRGIPGLKVTGDNAARVPNTLHVRVPGVSSDAMLTALDREGIQASMGSACHAGALKASHVLLAMGLAADEARRSLRFSLGWANTDRDVDKAAKAAVGAWQRLSRQ